MTESTRRRVALALAVGLGLLLAGYIVFRPGDQASAGVDLNDPNAWVEHGLDGELLQINGVTGEVTARVAVSEPGETISAVPHAAGAVVLNRTAGTISLIDGAALDVASTITLELAEEPDGMGARVFGLQSEEGDAIVVDDKRLLSIDMRSNVVTPVTLKDPIRHAAQSEDGRLYALRADSSVVQRLGEGGLEDVVELSAPVDGTDDQRTLVRAGSSIWVVDPARLSLAELLADGTTGVPECMTSAANGATIGGSGPTEAPLIVAYNPLSQMLSVSDPIAGSCTDVQLEVDGRTFGDPVVNNGFAYLPNWGANRIEVVDLGAEQAIASLPFGSGGEPFELEVVDSIVWANEPMGPFAAVVNESGLFPVAKLASIVAGAVEIDDDGDGETLTGADIDGSGLRVLGDSGDEVIATNVQNSGGQLPGNGPGTSEEAQLDTFEPDAGDRSVPSGVGVAAQGPPEAQNELTPELSSTLIANFGVSSARATVGEILRFTDFSSGNPTSWTWNFGDGTGAREPNTEKAWNTPGVYLVELVVTNAGGDRSSLSTEVSIVPDTVLIPPTADFAFDRDTIEEGESVALVSQTIGDADLLEWDFGDGEGARGPSVSHSYVSAGSYVVTLTAANPAGSTTASTTITVVRGVDPPLAAIGGLPSKIVNGQFVRLDSVSRNEPTRLTWDLGDGTRASGSSLRHAWSTPGTYRIRLTAENSAGSDSTFVDVVVSKRVDPPISQFTQSATEVLVGQTVSFSDLSLNEPTRLVWNFGDDTTASGPEATKSWSQPGRYRVTLRAVNEAGANRSGVTITVIKPVEPPVASFRADATTLRPGQAVSFTDTSSNTPTSWSWTFGDGASWNGPNPTHIFDEEGTYPVRLTVANEGGSSTTETQITVKAPPSANFRWTSKDRRVSFTDTSWDDPQEWFWDFGDGSTSTERSPDHRYEREGAYDVTLVVSNDVGSSAPRTETIRVGEPPKADFSCAADGALLVCDAKSSRNAVSYRWTSPDAQTNSTPNQVTTTFTYADSGRFDVTLVITNAAGETDSVTKRSPPVTRGRAPRISDVVVTERSGDLVRLEARFDRGPTSWEWSVKGAELVEGGNTPTPLFRVPENGSYDGAVTASNDFGSDSDTFRFSTRQVGTEQQIG